MGVTGAGKTTIGSLLAQRLGWEFADADSFHSPASVEKIRTGIALGDSDRAPWLRALHAAIQQWNGEGKSVVLACSALKGGYRDQLRSGGARFVYLKGSRELISQRLGLRRGHFASESILEGQFRDLEEPEDAIAVEINKTPEEAVSEIVQKLDPGET